MAKQITKRRPVPAYRHIRIPRGIAEMKQLISDKTIISSCTLLGSLAAYYYSKVDQKDIAPSVMIGGFVGTWAGEMIMKIKRKM